MSEQEVKVPDIGDFDEVPVIEVLVKAGDKVEKEQSLITLESEKATMEVPSPAAGTVKDVKVKEGDSVSEGALILTLEGADGGEKKKEDDDKEPKEKDEKKAEEKEASADKDEKAEEQGASADKGGETEDDEDEEEQKRDDDAHKPEKKQERSEEREDTDHDETEAREKSSKSAADLPHASPAVRRFARELGVDLSQVEGSGRKGRITQDDVQQHVKGVISGKGAAGAGMEVAAAPKVDFSRFGEVELEPLSRIRRIGGANLHRNWVTIPHVTQHDEADITELEAFRKAHQDEAKAKNAKLTLLAFLIKASVAALKRFPRFNSSLDETGERLVMKRYFHIGVAVDTENGLVVPVLRDCDTKGLIALAAELGEVSEKARQGKLSPGDMQGASFTISSLGGIGGSAFTPIINLPEVAILGVSRASTKPVWDGEIFSPRLILPLSLSYDHRVIDGADAARFTGYLGATLTDMKRVLL